MNLESTMATFHTTVLVAKKLMDGVAVPEIPSHFQPIHADDDIAA